MFGVDHKGGFTVGWIPKGSYMTLPGSSALSVGRILFTAKVGNRSEARERINSFDPINSFRFSNC